MLDRITRISLVLSISAGFAAAEERVDATLAGFASLPALTLTPPPDDAPSEVDLSGKFSVGDVPVRKAEQEEQNGIARPFAGQPVQGLSGFAAARGTEGSLFVMMDNGFGNKRNSSDVLLGFLELTADFETGKIEVRDRVWLQDPDFVVPFRIVQEGTERRYLTGGDFDPESLQIVAETVWIGDEFGPYLISATRNGRVTGVFPLHADGTALRSPDNPVLRSPAAAGKDWRVPRSGGFEALAVTPDDSTLWAMLERPLLDAKGQSEAYVRAFAFDPATRSWTGESFMLDLTEGAVAVGDLNFIDDTRALVIERDHGQGHPSAACKTDAETGCFKRPARVKRVTLIDISRRDETGLVRRLATIDLMDIADPEGRAGDVVTTGSIATGRFVFPFATIESVVRDGPEHILVGNDNNLPFSAGRQWGTADNSEIMRLHVPDLLSAR